MSVCVHGMSFPSAQSHFLKKGTTPLISAIVVLHSKSGKQASGSAVITAETLQEYQPDPASVLQAQTQFHTLGFQVSPLVGISFSITAAQSVFERTFRVTLQRNERGGVEVVNKNRSAGYELPLNKLPRELQGLISAVTFSPPPDFGPQEFFGPTP